MANASMRRAALTRAVLLPLGIMLAGASLDAAPRTPEAKTWPTYRGAWFTIRYPPAFRVRRGLRSATRPDGCDSAFFAAPDGSVEFYVFSPQWNGQPNDIELDPKTETLVSSKSAFRRAGGALGNVGRHVRWGTILARNGRYTRSYVDTKDTSINTRLVFGIRYQDRKAYARHSREYARFKASLIAYAD